jgi:hypothetical protein
MSESSTGLRRPSATRKSSGQRDESTNVRPSGTSSGIKGSSDALVMIRDRQQIEHSKEHVEEDEHLRFVTNSNSRRSQKTQMQESKKYCYIFEVSVKAVEPPVTLILYHFSHILKHPLNF